MPRSEQKAKHLIMETYYEVNMKTKGLQVMIIVSQEGGITPIAEALAQHNMSAGVVVVEDKPVSQHELINIPIINYVWEDIAPIVVKEAIQEKRKNDLNKRIKPYKHERVFVKKNLLRQKRF